MIHKVTAACKGRVGAGNYAVASIVHSSVASDDGGSFWHQAASTAAASVVLVEAGSEFYAIDSAELVGRSSAEDAVVIATPTRCPVKIDISF